MKGKKILFITPYPYDTAPSQRFRFEQYYKLLKKTDHFFSSRSFLNESVWKILYKKQRFLAKYFGVMFGFLSRILMLFNVRKFDYIFIHREATPIGPPFVEWWLTKVLKKRVIYDFDDAIWLSNTSKQNKLVSKLKFEDKVKQIIKWSYKVSCGNEYLASFAKQYNPNTVFNPTTIDTSRFTGQIKDQHTDPVIIGWTGSHSTVDFILPVLPVIDDLSKKYHIKFEVISDQPPKQSIDALTFRPWNKASEIEDLLNFNIGIMPLPDTEWAKGKCGLKALQYLALGIPAVVSPVGVNSEIVVEGNNGFLCSTEEEWYAALEKLILSESLRTAMGKKGVQLINENYSVESNANNFLSLFSSE